ASSASGPCSGSPVVTCNLGSLLVDGEAIINIVVTPTAAGQITNSASVSSGESDYDGSNNTASITTQVQPAAATPSMVDPNLTVSTVVSGLAQPISLAFLGVNDFLVLEKATGKVQRMLRDPISNIVTY